MAASGPRVLYLFRFPRRRRPPAGRRCRRSAARQPGSDDRGRRAAPARWPAPPPRSRCWAPTTAAKANLTYTWSVTASPAGRRRPRSAATAATRPRTRQVTFGGRHLHLHRQNHRRRRAVDHQQRDRDRDQSVTTSRHARHGHRCPAGATQQFTATGLRPVRQRHGHQPALPGRPRRAGHRRRPVHRPEHGRRHHRHRPPAARVRATATGDRRGTFLNLKDATPGQPDQTLCHPRRVRSPART